MMYFLKVTSSKCDEESLNMENAVVIDLNTGVGCNVTYECRAGFALTNGSLQLMCGTDLQWNGPPPVCEGMF